MIVRRLFLVLAAAFAFAACAGVCVVALAFTLYALTVPWVGAAGAAGIVAGAAALTIGVGALGLALGARARRNPRKQPPASGGVVERAIALVKEKPAIAIVAAVAAGLVAVRNPRYLGAALRSFVEGRELPRR